MRAGRPGRPLSPNIARRFGSFLLIAAMAACLSSCTSPDTERQDGRDGFRIVDGQIVTDVFDVTATLNDDRTLTVGLDTDLGDSTRIMVNVSRSYIDANDDSEHSIDYFSEPGTVGDWRDPRTIAISEVDWRQRLEDQQTRMAGLGLGFTVERILDDVNVSFVVPNQQDPPFETDNLNLTGSAVYGDSIRNVRDDVVVPLPIDGEVR
jgi:hypothetical protein